MVYWSTGAEVIRHYIRILKSKRKFQNAFFPESSQLIGGYFIINKLPTVYELHIYDILKCVLKRSVNHLHSEKYLNDLFRFLSPERSTRLSILGLLDETLSKKRLHQFWIRFRATKLFNSLKTPGLLLINVDTLGEVERLYHAFKYQYIINNFELVKHIFDFS